MNRFAGALMALFAVAGAALAQENLARLYSHPVVPPDEVLDRLHLKLAWRTFIPTDGRRDGLLTVHVLNDQIVVQTRSGLMVALNPKDGSAQWRAAIGFPYRAYNAIAHNDRSVIAYNGVNLFGLDRKTGQFQWALIPENAPSAGPVADDERIYLCQATGRLDVYELPDGKEKKLPPPPGAAPAAGTPAATESPTLPVVESPLAPADVTGLPRTVKQPQFIFGFRPGGRLERTPLLAENTLHLADTTGLLQGVYKLGPNVQYSVDLESPVTAPMAQFGSIAYIASLDQHVTALDIGRGRIDWQFLAAAPVRIQPAVTEEDVYVTAEAAGLHRINRRTGDEIWRNAGAGQFLAANKSLVYARDIQGARLLIIDRQRGTTLTQYKVRDFVFPIANTTTDRLFLAANDGSLACFHDRAYAAPMSWQPAPEAPAQPTKPAKKPAEPKAPPPSEGKPTEK
jgi:outer membrane protein assembly factor BamB